MHPTTNDIRRSNTYSSAECQLSPIRHYKHGEPLIVNMTFQFNHFSSVLNSRFGFSSHSFIRFMSSDSSSIQSKLAPELSVYLNMPDFDISKFRNDPGFLAMGVAIPIYDFLVLIKLCTQEPDVYEHLSAENFDYRLFMDDVSQSPLYTQTLKDIRDDVQIIMGLPPWVRSSVPVKEQKKIQEQLQAYSKIQRRIAQAEKEIAAKASQEREKLYKEHAPEFTNFRESDVFLIINMSTSEFLFKDKTYIRTRKEDLAKQLFVQTFSNQVDFSTMDTAIKASYVTAAENQMVNEIKARYYRYKDDDSTQECKHIKKIKVVKTIK